MTKLLLPALPPVSLGDLHPIVARRGNDFPYHLDKNLVLVVWRITARHG
jgi:hypothetical protein